jgi:hypothetical protein
MAGKIIDFTSWNPGGTAWDGALPGNYDRLGWICGEIQDASRRWTALQKRILLRNLSLE